MIADRVIHIAGVRFTIDRDDLLDPVLSASVRADLQRLIDERLMVIPSGHRFDQEFAAWPSNKPRRRTLGAINLDCI